MSAILGAVAQPLIPAIPSSHKTSTERFNLVLFALIAQSCNPLPPASLWNLKTKWFSVVQEGLCNREGMKGSARLGDAGWLQRKENNSRASCCLLQICCVKALLWQRDCFDFSSQNHLLTIALINRRCLFRS